ncbi:MAG: dipeptide ABC transporter ATP-binding protein [Planctomycetes bacterium]|nr:dipeptide ABC transporter ATP-binding protein [Planctomycetota bacterium]
MNKASAPLLRVKNLKKYFPIRAGLFGKVRDYVKAVDGVSFDLAPGETLGLVGESGCGKTTVGRSILRLIEPTGGDVQFAGHDLMRISNHELRNLRREMQIIFQDPYSSLNPRMTVEQIIGEAMTVHGIARGEDRRRRVGELLERCGLSSRAMGRYPHEFSGGQRQRVGIARALALSPKFIVCDEAVSALDVSIQAQVINLLMDIQEERGLSYLFIAHDLSVVEHISTRVAVMYLGHVAELATSGTLYENPLHPYTRALLSAVPLPDPERAHERIILEGDPPTPINPPSGCVFHPRCWLAEPRCKTEVPELRDLGGGHIVACHLVDAQSQSLVKDGKVIPPGSGKRLPTADEGPATITVEEAAADEPEATSAEDADAAQDADATKDADAT